MVFRHYGSAHWMAALLAAGVPAAVAANEPVSDSEPVEQLMERASSSLPEKAGGGWAVAVDNDLFAPAQTDRDYTGGLGVTIGGKHTADYWWSIDPLLGRIDRVVLPEAKGSSDAGVHHAVQIGLLSFTPEDLSTVEVVTADRPYASLLFVTAARQYVASDERTLRYGELTLGALGLSFASDLHNAIHRVVGSDPARGYANQISAGGEPTARYVTGGSTLRARHLALGDRLLEATTTWESSAGYISEASYAVSARLGDIHSPWWSFNPERADYLGRTASVARRRDGATRELYVFAGARLTLCAYNAFLQGQFRDSAHTFAADEIQLQFLDS